MPPAAIRTSPTPEASAKRSRARSSSASPPRTRTGDHFLLGMPTGRTPKPILAAMAGQLARQPQSLRHVTLVMMDEYLVPAEHGMQYAPAESPWSCHHFARAEILARLNGVVPPECRLDDERIWFPLPARACGVRAANCSCRRNRLLPAGLGGERWARRLQSAGERARQLHADHPALRGDASRQPADVPVVWDAGSGAAPRGERRDRHDHRGARGSDGRLGRGEAHHGRAHAVGRGVFALLAGDADPRMRARRDRRGRGCRGVMRSGGPAADTYRRALLIPRRLP